VDRGPLKYPKRHLGDQGQLVGASCREAETCGHLLENVQQVFCRRLKLKHVDISLEMCHTCVTNVKMYVWKNKSVSSLKPVY
jgi:hypothetical protein